MGLIGGGVGDVLYQVPVVGGILGTNSGAEKQKAAYAAQQKAYEAQRATTAQAAQKGKQEALDPYNDAMARSQSAFEQAGPGAAQQWYDQNQGAYAQGAGMGQNYFQQTGNAAFQPGVGEGYWQQVAGRAGGPGAAQHAWGQGVQKLQGNTTGQGMTPWALGQLQGPSALQQYGAATANMPFEQTASERALMTAQRGMMQQPQNAQAVFNQYQGGPSGLGGQYDRAVTQGLEDLNASLAAQGLIGSSGGARQAAELVEGLRSEQAAAEGKFGLEQARLRGDLARGADVGGQERWQGLGNIAASADQAQLGRYQTGADIAQGIDQGRVNRVMAGGQFSQGVDRGVLDSAMGMGDLAGMYEGTDLDRTMGFGNLALDAQQAAQQRQQQGYDQAMGVDELNLGRARAGQEAASAANLYGNQQLGMEQQAMLDYAAGMSGASSAWNTQGQEWDQAMMDAIYASQMGAADLQRQQQDRDANRFMSDVGTASNAFANLYGAGMFTGAPTAGAPTQMGSYSPGAPPPVGQPQLHSNSGWSFVDQPAPPLPPQRSRAPQRTSRGR